jgi:hypothetical protein
MDKKQESAPDQTGRVFGHNLDPKARIKVTRPREKPSRDNPKPDVLVYGREQQGKDKWGPERPYLEDELTPIR